MFCSVWLSNVRFCQVYAKCLPGKSHLIPPIVYVVRCSCVLLRKDPDDILNTKNSVSMETPPGRRSALYGCSPIFNVFLITLVFCLISFQM